MFNNNTPNELDKKNFLYSYGFGLVDAIVSLSLLSAVITYGIYFASTRLNTAYNSNLTTSVNKEIERDIERLKSDFWGMYFEESADCQGEYCQWNGEPLTYDTCSDFTEDIVNLNSWNIEKKFSNLMIQSWKPGQKRSKVFTGQPVTISREIQVNSPLDEEYLNKTVASINYRVKWSENDIHWLSISLSPEANSWCKSLI
tara:strand:+ start:78 stop:677 length:600 start_codon:yes stop_codon:yes gene_type:complete